MDKENELSELQKEVRVEKRQQVQKFVYYVLALSVACLAFSVNLSKDVKIEWSQIPLGIAAVCWSLSALIGLKSLTLMTQILEIEHVMYEGRKGINDDGKDYSEQWKFLGEMNEDRKGKVERFESGQKGQFYLFIIGIALFITWHVLEMALRT